MLKGIKIKQNSIKPEPYHEKVNITELLKESENNLKSQKKWKKEKELFESKESNRIEMTQEIGKQIIKNEGITTDQLKGLSKNLWMSFVKHDVKNASEAYLALKVKHEKYLQYEFFKTKNLNEFNQSLNFEMIQKNDENYQESAFSKNMMQTYIEEKKRDTTSSMNQEFLREISKISQSENYEDDKLDHGDEQIDEKQKRKKEIKYEEKIHKRNKMTAKRLENRNNRILSNCQLCFSNKKIQPESVLYIGDNLYITLSNKRKFNDHYLVIPMEHYSSTMEMEDEIFEEFQEIKKKFIEANEKEQRKTIFFEYSINLNKLPHLTIECLAIPKELLTEAQMYFKKYLVEMEGDWTTHKKIIEIKSDTNIKKKIPKSFPYFFVDFNMEFGYAHIVEKEKSFDSNMHMEIMESLLNEEDSERNVYDIEKAKLRFRNFVSFKI